MNAIEAHDGRPVSDPPSIDIRRPNLSNFNRSILYKRRRTIDSHRSRWPTYRRRSIAAMGQWALAVRRDGAHIVTAADGNQCRFSFFGGYFSTFFRLFVFLFVRIRWHFARLVGYRNVRCLFVLFLNSSVVFTGRIARRKTRCVCVKFLFHASRSEEFP